MTPALILAAFLAASPAPGKPPTVSPSLVCSVQHAIRWRDSAWTPAQCERVAGALNSTRDPVEMAAICVNESDMRPGVAVESRPGVFDVGFCGVRCVTARDTRASSLALGQRVLRGQLKPNQPTGRCLNGPARGYSLEQLRDPVVNVAVAAQIAEAKRAAYGKDWHRHYNGGTREHGYTGRIAALVAALGGVQVKVQGKRMRELTAKVVAAVRGENRS